MKYVVLSHAAKKIEMHGKAVFAGNVLWHSRKFLFQPMDCM